MQSKSSRRQTSAESAEPTRTLPVRRAGRRGNGEGSSDRIPATTATESPWPTARAVRSTRRHVRS
jgi:hypothetical protein